MFLSEVAMSSGRIAELIEKIRANRYPAPPPPPVATENGVPLNPARRAENLHLLRTFLNARQEDMVTMLSLSSQSYFSQVERGEKTLASWEARQIEQAIGLPDGWFERNNATSLFLSPKEFDLIVELRNVGADTADAVLTLLRALKQKE